MNSNVIGIIAFIVAIVVGIAMIILYKRRVIDADVISGANSILQGLPITEGSGAFGLIAGYAKIAVQTVEQLVSTGAIERDDATRKEAALNIVENAAKVDNIPYGKPEQAAASACIEAEVWALPRNNQTADTAQQADNI